MTGEPWLWAALAVQTAGHLLAAWLGQRQERRSEGHHAGHGGADAADAPPADASVGDGLPDETVVECRECGTLNERGYRRCRHCVGTLPGAEDRVARRVPARGGIRP